MLPIACSELDFFMLSGVFIVLPLDPEWGQNKTIEIEFKFPPATSLMELSVLDNQVLDWGPLEPPLKSWGFEKGQSQLTREFLRPERQWIDASSLGSCIPSPPVPAWSEQAPTQVPCRQKIYRLGSRRVFRCRGTWFSQQLRPLVQHPLDPAPLFLLSHLMRQVYPVRKQAWRIGVCMTVSGKTWRIWVMFL